MNRKPSYQSLETYGFAAGQALATAAASGQLPNTTPTIQLVGLLSATLIPIIFGWLRTSLKKPVSADEALPLNDAIKAAIDRLDQSSPAPVPALIPTTKP